MVGRPDIFYVGVMHSGLGMRLSGLMGLGMRSQGGRREEWWFYLTVRYRVFYTNSMQRVSKCESVVFYRAAARRRRAAAPC